MNNLDDIAAGVAAGIDYTRRFGGVSRLYGEAAAARFATARVCVVGIGGVGSWAAEALARSAVGRITLVDLDMIAESNTNRQVHALGDAYGMAKVDAMRSRIVQINPTCEVTVIEDFVSEENVARLLGGYDVVLDAIDDVRVKTAMVVFCRAANVPLFVCGGAGGKSDPARIRIDDLTRTTRDPLLAKLRKRLRQNHGFPRDIRRRFGIPTVYSDELVLDSESCALDEAPQGLSCAGYGSSVCVTASMGLFAAAAVLKLLSSSAAAVSAAKTTAEGASDSSPSMMQSQDGGNDACMSQP
ncbi:MAG TPA: tRNA threonylcarbamoyladenosine dehydratase [Rhodocyclaceae bacterium]|nr:tRNA threonylcarbamoyladenosine dehydratase [Rhodocyclaceae bacterium]